MKFTLLFLSLMVAAGIAVAVSGCGSSGPAPMGAGGPPIPPNGTPAPNLLYVDHNGTFYIYRLPLTQRSKPERTLTEWPELAAVPVIAADQFGNVAVSSQTELRLFQAPIRSFAQSRAKLQLELTPAITAIGTAGQAALIDLEYDPNENLWLFNNLGPGITVLRSPVTQSSVAAIFIPFGAPGSKTANFTTLVQGRFDINATLYVYALSSKNVPPVGRLFKLGFPYAKPPGTIGMNLAQADFVDSSQWPPNASNAPTLLLGQYTGPLRSPKPGSPPSPPVNVTSQFAQPFTPQQGLFPSDHTNTIAGALAADTYRFSYYTLDAGDGKLQVWDLPMRSNAKPKLTLPCLAGIGNCGEKPEHLFLAP
ncbi:MAG: hypothetical protein WAL67_06025 [Candidatus Cybelea sp.]